jgi:uncharacterized protein (TIGR02266 family)
MRRRAGPGAGFAEPAGVAHDSAGGGRYHVVAEHTDLQREPAGGDDGELARLREALEHAQSEIETLGELLRLREAQLATLRSQLGISRRPGPNGPPPLPRIEPPSSPEPAQLATKAPEAEQGPDHGCEVPCSSLTRIAVLEEERSTRSDGAERRSSERWACALELEFTNESQFFAGLTQDISRGGLFIATYRKLAVGTPLRLRFDLPGGATVDVSGEVRWVREPTAGGTRPGLGVAFTDLAPEALEQIRAFCETTPPLYVEL